MGVIGTSTTRVLPFRGDGRSGLLPARCESPRRPRHLVRRAAADGTGAGSGESAGASVRRAGASVRQTSASVRRPVQVPLLPKRLAAASACGSFPGGSAPQNGTPIP